MTTRYKGFYVAPAHGQAASGGSGEAMITREDVGIVLIWSVLFCGWAAMLCGCEPVPPRYATVPIMHGTAPEVTETMEVHLIGIRERTGLGEHIGVPAQEALVAWVSSFQNLEVVDFERIGGDGGGGDLLILAKRRPQ